MTPVQEQRLWRLIAEIYGPDLKSVLLMVTSLKGVKGGQLLQESLLIGEPKPVWVVKPKRKKRNE